MLQLLDAQPVVPVIEINDPNHAVPLARALLAGGINVIEITFRTDAAADAMSAIFADVPDMRVGAGTVVTKEQAKRALDLGVAFGVAPGLNPATVEMFQAAGTPFLPGVATPSEIERALALGLQTLKFFPAGNLGSVAMLKALSGPYASLGVRFCPTGGVNPDNLRDYLALPTVAAVGGSWIATKQQIAAGDWAGITARATEALKLARG